MKWLPALLWFALICLCGTASPCWAASGSTLAEGRTASLALLNQGGDLATQVGLLQEVTSIVTAGNGVRFGAFGLTSGGSSRYGDGSFVDVDGGGLLTGFGGGIALSDFGVFGMSAFFEGGHGRYTGRVGHSLPAVRGRGDTDYQGGGILARFDSMKCPLYVEASLRTGHTETDFAGQASGSAEASYNSAHGKIGAFWRDKTIVADMSTAYLWAHQAGVSTAVQSETAWFAPVASHRWRSGVKATYYGLAAWGIPYAGAFWEYEFDGRAQVDLGGRRFSGTCLQGGMATGEAGLIFILADIPLLAIDLGVRGYTGSREGVAGSVQVNFSF